jgi:hypothetical protein
MILSQEEYAAIKDRVSVAEANESVKDRMKRSSLRLSSRAERGESRHGQKELES